MEMTYAIDDEHRLVIVKRRGDWGIDDFIRSFEKMQPLLARCQAYDLVSDLVEANAAFTPQELSRLTAYIHQHPVTRGQTLLIVNKPLETALAMLYQNSVFPAGHISIFSTVEAVSAYLGYDISPLLDTL